MVVTVSETDGPVPMAPTRERARKEKPEEDGRYSETLLSMYSFVRCL